MLTLRGSFCTEALLGLVGRCSVAQDVAPGTLHLLAHCHPHTKLAAQLALQRITYNTSLHRAAPAVLGHLCMLCRTPFRNQLEPTHVMVASLHGHGACSVIRHGVLDNIRATPGQHTRSFSCDTSVFALYSHTLSAQQVTPGLHSHNQRTICLAAGGEHTLATCIMMHAPLPGFAVAVHPSGQGGY